MEQTAYHAEMTAWRQKLDDSLRQENGWLALAGLFWLAEGDNAFGSDPQNPVVLPAGTAAQLGILRLTADTITLHTTAAADVCINGAKVQEAVLLPDSSGTPTLVTVGQITMMVIQREAVYGIRMWDNGRSQRHTYPGRQWYPLDENYCLPATFTAYDDATVITLSRSQGGDFEDRPVGYVNFWLDGQEYRLTTFQTSPHHLFVPFKDATSGRETYGSGRYLIVDLAQNGRTTLDFNRAFHPPCSITAYATCTLPPRQNWLKIAIPAGERLAEPPLSGE